MVLAQLSNPVAQQYGDIADTISLKDYAHISKSSNVSNHKERQKIPNVVA